MKIVKIHEPCRVRSSENIAQKRKLSIIPEILPIPPASTKQKQRNEQRNEKKSEQLHLIENPNKHKEIINQSIYAKAFEKRFSNIPCKSSSFYLLYFNFNTFSCIIFQFEISIMKHFFVFQKGS